MQTMPFDRLARTLASVLSRRGLACAIGLPGLGFPGLMEAKKKRKKHKKKKVIFNDFGCVNVGSICQNSDQCCSGSCAGKKGKKKCRAHDPTTCQAGEVLATCGGVHELCFSTGGDEGACATTTGNAGYCVASGDCFACTKDADCEAVCGPGAACIPCAETCSETERGGTFCAGPVAGSCNFDT